MRVAVLLLLTAGCAPEAPQTIPTGPQTGGGTPGGTPGGSATGSGTPGATTTGSGTTSVPFTWDCTTPLPAAPVPFTNQTGYSEAEDFDFHPDGWAGLVYQTNLVGKDRYGGTTVISPDVSSNAASTRVLSTGDWVISDVSGGRVIRVDHVTGAKETLLGGLSWPNGIEVGSNDDLYMTDFSTGRVFTFNAWNPDPVTQIDIGQPQANGIALSPDEQTLYVVLSWTAAVIAYDRQPGGGWSAARVVLLIPGADFQGLVSDYCGNLYVTDAYPGQHSYIIRIRADETNDGIIATLPSGYVPNAHFGHDIGGWNRFMLYASDREQGRLFELDVGVPGKQHPALP